MSERYLKTSRSFSLTKKISWVLVPIIAAGGLYFPVLGLAVIGVMFALMIMGLFKGKHWCGNICPHGSLFDFVLLRAAVFKKIPGFFRSSALKWGFLVFFMAMFGYRLMFALDYLGETGFAARLGSVFVNQYLVFPTIVGVGLALAINPRTWCSFCPMGTIQQIMNKAGQVIGLNRNYEEFITITDPESCTECGKCARVCPMQLAPYRNWESMQFKDENCIKCYTCVRNCPSELLYSSTLLPGEDYRESAIEAKKHSAGEKSKEKSKIVN